MRILPGIVRDAEGGASADPKPTPPAPAPDPTAGTRSREAELRAEAAAERVARRKAEEQGATLQSQLDALRAESETKLQSAVAKVTERLSKIQQRAVDAELKAAAQAAGLVDLDLLPLLDRSGVKVGDDDSISGVAEAIEAFKVKKPDWFKAPAAAATTAAPAAPTTTGRPVPAAAGTGTGTGQKDVKKMTPEEYSAFKRKTLGDLRVRH